jgi:glutamyl-tRNA synthetase
MIKVRFAPSPTGPLHIGSVRTALFSWLFAKINNGKFVLRIEDTDKERSKPEFEKEIIDGLKWLGFNWDEFYRQSERTSIYSGYLEKLLNEKKVYRCFCTKEELEAEKQSMSAAGLPPKYSGRCRNLSDKEIKEKSDRGEKYVLRFKVPEKIVSFKDLIRGEIKFDSALIGDIVIAKNLTEPLYNFVVVIDDELMGITHVIRGEDHISNTPKQILIAEALGFKIPHFAHLPIILNPDRSKMSKRFADTALKDYIEAGYLPDAILNFLALLGWHPVEDKEIISREELIKEFTLDRIQKAGAIFNIEKLDWLNNNYLNNLNIEKFIELSNKFLPAGWKLNEAIASSIKGRVKKMSELKDFVDFYFKLPDYDMEMLKWKNMNFDEVAGNLNKLLEVINKLQDKDFKKDILEKELNAIVPPTGRGEFFWPLRASLSGKKTSPGPFEILESLGKKESMDRLKSTIERIKQKLS